MKRVTARKYGGDDSASWAVFIDSTPVRHGTYEAGGPLLEEEGSGHPGAGTTEALDSSSFAELFTPRRRITMTTHLLLHCPCQAEIEVEIRGNRQHVEAEIVRRDCTCDLIEELITEEAIETINDPFFSRN